MTKTNFFVGLSFGRRLSVLHFSLCLSTCLPACLFVCCVCLFVVFVCLLYLFVVFVCRVCCICLYLFICLFCLFVSLSLCCLFCLFVCLSTVNYESIVFTFDYQNLLNFITSCLNYHLFICFTVEGKLSMKCLITWTPRRDN